MSDQVPSRSVVRRLAVQREAKLLKRLNEATKGEITWESFGGGYPVQGEGVTGDGERVYFRFRHNEAQLYVGYDPLDSTSFYSELRDVFRHPGGALDDERGFLDADEAVDLVERLFYNLEECDIHETRRGRLARFLENIAAQARLAPPTSDELEGLKKLAPTRPAKDHER